MDRRAQEGSSGGLAQGWGSFNWGDMLRVAGQLPPCANVPQDTRELAVLAVFMDEHDRFGWMTPQDRTTATQAFRALCEGRCDEIRPILLDGGAGQWEDKYFAWERNPRRHEGKDGGRMAGPPGLGAASGGGGRGGVLPLVIGLGVAWLALKAVK